VGKGQWPLFPDGMQNPILSPQIVGIKDALVLKTDTQETENLDKAISFDQKGASMYLLQLNRHVNTKWPTVAPPYIPDTVVHAPNPGFVQVKGSHLS
jgi:hypothetical protein